MKTQPKGLKSGLAQVNFTVPADQVTIGKKPRARARRATQDKKPSKWKGLSSRTWLVAIVALVLIAVIAAVFTFPQPWSRTTSPSPAAMVENHRLEVFQKKLASSEEERAKAKVAEEAIRKQLIVALTEKQLALAKQKVAEDSQLEAEGQLADVKAKLMEVEAKVAKMVDRPVPAPALGVAVATAKSSNNTLQIAYPYIEGEGWAQVALVVSASDPKLRKDALDALPGVPPPVIADPTNKSTQVALEVLKVRRGNEFIPVWGTRNPPPWALPRG